MPSSWDETRVLEGLPGETIAIARKSGNTWYIGGMSIDKRNFVLDTDFLEDEKVRLVSWCDGSDTDKNPRSLFRHESILHKGEKLSFTVGANGGFVAILKPSD